MRAGACVALISVLCSTACQSSRPTGTPEKVSPIQTSEQQALRGSDFQGVKTNADIAKLSWVNKRCRLWAADGEIDIDQTCLVVKTVAGGLVAIPNEYVDKEMQEVTGQLNRPQKHRDRWILRFYEIGGGEKPRK